MTNDITLKELVDRIEERLDERLDKFEAKLDTFVTEERLQSKIHSVRAIQEKYGLEVKEQEKRIDTMERFLFLLKVVGGPVFTIITTIITAKILGLI